MTGEFNVCAFNILRKKNLTIIRLVNEHSNKREEKIWKLAKNNPNLTPTFDS